MAALSSAARPSAISISTAAGATRVSRRPRAGAGTQYGHQPRRRLEASPRSGAGQMTASLPYRLPQGGRIDRASPRSFSLDGRLIGGFKGDTLASAVLASGLRLVGRSFKYHRPRGLLSAGIEEPNALFTLGEGGRTE